MSNDDLRPPTTGGADPGDVTVSTEEMSALMETIQEGAKSRTLGLDGSGESTDVVRYDLVAARSVGRGQLPTLDLVNERFAGLMADAMRRASGSQASVSVTAAAPIKFVECLGNLPSLTCVQVVELVGLRGTGIITFDPSLLFHIIDMLLGGNPTAVVDASGILSRRGLTAVERRLFAHLVNTLGKALTKAWDGVAPLGIRPLRAETDPRHVAIFEHAEMVVDTVFDVEVAGCSGKVHIVLPHAALRPIEKKLASGLLDAGPEDASSWKAPLTGLLRDVTCVCTAELGRTTITVRELLSLATGDVIRLDRDPENPITVYVEGAPKLLGTPTLEHGNIAIEVDSKITVAPKGNEDRGVNP